MDPALIGLMVFATVFVATVALIRRAPAQEIVADRLREIEVMRTPRAVVLAQPFYRRALFPFLGAVGGAFTRFLPTKSLGAVRHNLEMAGRRHSDPAAWIILKWGRSALFAGLVYGLGGLRDMLPSAQLMLAVSMGGLAYLWPELSIRGAISRRQALILKELPETLDLLSITVEAGLGLDQALETVSRQRHGPLSDEIRVYLDEVGFGGDRQEALRAIGSRTGVEELISFTGTVVQAMEFGVSIAVILRIQADEARTRRRQRIEERAMKAPVKMLFPLIFLILPAIFVVTAGPGLIRAYVEFIKPGGAPGRFAPPPQR